MCLVASSSPRGRTRTGTGRTWHLWEGRPWGRCEVIVKRGPGRSPTFGSFLPKWPIRVNRAGKVTRKHRARSPPWLICDLTRWRIKNMDPWVGPVIAVQWDPPWSPWNPWVNQFHLTSCPCDHLPPAHRVVPMLSQVFLISIENSRFSWSCDSFRREMVSREIFGKWMSWLVTPGDHCVVCCWDRMFSFQPLSEWDGIDAVDCSFDVAANSCCAVSFPRRQRQANKVFSESRLGFLATCAVCRDETRLADEAHTWTQLSHRRTMEDQP